MRAEFEQLIKKVSSLCKELFSERIVATFLCGNIEQEDFVPEVSELDFCVVIADNPSEADSQRTKEISLNLQSEYPVIKAVHITALSIDTLRSDKLMRFKLRYNALLYSGLDIAYIVDSQSTDCLNPDRSLAKSRLRFAKKCFDDALDNKCPECMDKIPKNTYYAAYIFAQHFVLNEGAYFLMTRKRFRSFMKKDVLLRLRKNTSGFDNILNTTADILKNPIKANISHQEYLILIKPFIEWIFSEIENA